MVEFDADLRSFTGHVIDLRDEIHFEGSSVEELEASMKRAVDHHLAVCARRGEEPERPFSGKLNLRLGANLHRAAALAAAADGESLNNWLVKVVESAAKQNPRKQASFTERPAKRTRTKTSRERSG